MFVLRVRKNPILFLRFSSTRNFCFSRPEFRIVDKNKTIRPLIITLRRQILYCQNKNTNTTISWAHKDNNNSNNKINNNNINYVNSFSRPVRTVLCRPEIITAITLNNDRWKISVHVGNALLDSARSKARVFKHESFETSSVLVYKVE